MIETEFSKAIDLIKEAPGGQEVMCRAADAYHRAAEEWGGNVHIPRLGPGCIEAAQAVARDISLIADGVLHLLDRAPDGPAVGILSRAQI